MKKLISIFAAVILVLSAFAAIPASAAEVVLYSQNFDGVATPADAGFPDVDSRSSGATPFAGTLSIVDGKLKATTEAANSKLYWFAFLDGGALSLLIYGKNVEAYFDNIGVAGYNSKPETTAPAPVTTEAPVETSAPAADTTAPAGETTEAPVSPDTGDAGVLVAAAVCIIMLTGSALLIVKRRKEN